MSLKSLDRHLELEGNLTPSPKRWGNWGPEMGRDYPKLANGRARKKPQPLVPTYQVAFLGPIQKDGEGPALQQMASAALVKQSSQSLL